MKWYAALLLLGGLACTASGKPQGPQQVRGGNWLKERVSNSNFSYRGLSIMLHKSEHVLRTLNHHIQSIRSQAAVTPEERLRMEVLQVYQRELKATVNSLVMVLSDLNQTLTSDYSSLEKIKHSCQFRLEDMRAAAVLVEEDYNSILELEHEVHAIHPNLSHYSVINEILTEISHAADDLENELEADFFRSSKNMEGAAFETVVKLWDSSFHGLSHLDKLQEEGVRRRDNRESDHGIPVLVDSASNRYVLSRPRDVTVPMEDHRLVHDVVSLLLLSFLLGGVCSMVKIPSLFGYMFAGTVLGPVGCNVIGSIVQLESIGEFGVIFIVFVIGLEFSPERLRKVWQISVYGSNLLLVVSILLAVLLGLLFDVKPRQAVFVAACLSLSSTSLAMKLISVPTISLRRSRLHDENTRSPSPEALESEFGSSLLGLLVMQDIQLGLLMALMPFFSAGHTHHTKTTFITGFLQFVFGFCLLVVVAQLMASKLLDKFYRMLSLERGRNESILLGSVAVCFLLLLLADVVGASTELACFLAGVAITCQTNSVVDHVRQLVEPLRDLFAVFFFVSVGFHVFPTFLLSEFTTIFLVTFCVLALKFVLGVCVLGLFLGHCQSATWVVVLALTPVSEFSFVLASRCRRLGIISREVYLVILSVTALSLLLGPLLWRLIFTAINIRRGFGHWRKWFSAYLQSKR